MNHNLPRTFGDGIIHESHIDAMVDCTLPLPELKKVGLSDEEVRIGQLIAENLVDDGATLQMGENLWEVNTLFMEETLRNCFCLPSEEGSALIEKNLLPLRANLVLE